MSEIITVRDYWDYLNKIFLEEEEDEGKGDSFIF
jgi:hypothetical protein